MLKLKQNQLCWLRMSLPVIAACGIIAPIPAMAILPEGGEIVVKAEKRLLNSSRQDIVVKGKVTSAAENQPLPGVVVKVKGGAQGTSTDINGNYTLQVDEDAVLVFSYVGFTTVELPVGGRARIDVGLIVSEQLLNEVVVRVPYGTQTRAAFTGSATTIKGETVAQRPRASFQESLQGNVPGLQVSQGSGQPGAEVAVRIRGIGSFSASNSPLYVVDGIPVVDVPATGYAWSSNTLAGINSNDIESVTVLKDASATSIYGSRAGNGVILITTKRGAAGKTKVDGSVQRGVANLTMTDRNKPLNSQEMTELLVEGVMNNQTLRTAQNITTAQQAQAYLVTQGLNTNVNTDWFDLVTQDGQYDQYNLSASGGNDKTTFLVSGGYYNQEAVVKGVDFQRLNTRVNLSHKTGGRLSLNGSLGANYQDMNTMRAAWWGENPIRNMRLTVPWVSPYNPDGTYNTGIAYNNEILVNENKKNTKIYQLLGNLGTEIRIFDPLSFESKVGIDFNISDEELYWDPLWIDAQALNGVGGNYVTKLTNWNLVNLLKYRQQIRDFALDVTLGHEAQQIDRKLLAGEKANFAAQNLETLDAASQLLYVGSAKLEFALQSIFLNTSLNYKQKYYLNLSGRRDQASPFGLNNKWGTFGAIGLAWNVEKEGFMESLPFINALKIRGSYGVNGNIASDWYAWRGAYNVGSNYANLPGYSVGKPQNADLGWEKNKPFDIGLDFSVLNNRLSGTFDYYTRTTTDLILGVPISRTNGASLINRNVGSFKNYGIELSLNSRNVVSKNFEWSTSFNISTLNNELLKLSQKSIVDGLFVREEGEDFYQFYMKGWAGVDPQTGEGMWYTDASKTATTKNYAAAGLFKQGSALPDFFGGLTNNFSYKGFGLSFQFYFNSGNKIYDNYGHFTASDGSAGTSTYGAMDRVVYENRWQNPGDITNTPKVVYGNTQTGTGQQSTRFMYDGSYLRLRDLTLSYDIPKNKYLSNARIYLRGNNLWTYLKDDVLPYDPEGYLGGLNNGQIPVSKQILLGLNLSF